MIVLTAGRFGAAVGARLTETRGAEVAPLIQEREALVDIVACADFVAVAVWRPYVHTFNLIDDLCFDARTPWSLAEIHGQRLTCGPLVYPGSGACYHCYRQRWLSHHPAPERELVLQNCYEREHSLGAPGFVAPLVEIAANALASDAAAPPSKAGRLRFVDVLTAAVLESGVIGVHEYKRCRPRTSMKKGDRFIRDLIPGLEGILE